MSNLTSEYILRILSENKVDFKSTHNKLSIPIINRIYKKMKHGIKFDDIKIFNNLIIDGHHRYVSSILSETELGCVKSSKTSATIDYNWENVEFVSEEWDTENKIRRLNELDAKFNNISIEKIIEIIK
jgi:hypothetical protein